MIVHREGIRETREHPRAEKLAPVTALGNLTGIRVLAIDDEKDALGLLRVVLESAGAEVFTIASAKEALATIDSIDPDALVVDLGMPEMDGFEFISRVRSSRRRVSRCSGRRADGIRALRGPDTGAAKRLRDAPRKAGRSR